MHDVLRTSDKKHEIANEKWLVKTLFVAINCLNRLILKAKTWIENRLFTNAIWTFLHEFCNEKCNNWIDINAWFAKRIDVTQIMQQNVWIESKKSCFCASDQRIESVSSETSETKLTNQQNNVRFSDEFHAKHENVDRVYVIRKSNMRVCFFCIQHTVSELKEKRNQKRKHWWVAVNYDFKSNITFYIVFDNKNDKMNLQMYRDCILKSIVKSWLEQIKRDDYIFTLEKDDDSEHDTDKNNIVRTWKKQNDLNYYFNCSEFSNLTSIENCWQNSKQWFKRISHWNDEIIESLIAKDWKHHCLQRFINEHMCNMSRRLKNVIELENQMIDW